MDFPFDLLTVAVFVAAAAALTLALTLARTRRRLRRVESSARTRRMLLADVSHELMAPLTAIRGYVETLQLRDIDLDDEARRRALAIVEQECDRLEHLLSDLHELARTDAGGGAFSPGQVRTHDVFERIRRRHQRDIDGKRLRFDVAVESLADEMWADVDRVDQAVENLVTNAIRHTGEGGRISLQASCSHDELHITVTDDGAGIEAEHLPFVFERFYRAGLSPGSPSGGSGLGLSIVKAIAERHGGRVGVTSRPGETVFAIVIPRQKPSASRRPS